MFKKLFEHINIVPWQRGGFDAVPSATSGGFTPGSFSGLTVAFFCKKDVYMHAATYLPAHLLKVSELVNAVIESRFTYLGTHMHG